MEETFLDLVGEFWIWSVVETLVDILLYAVLIWLAVMIGLVIGWAWRPRWTGLLFLSLWSRFRFVWTVLPPRFDARRLWLAFTALSTFFVCRTIWSNFKEKNGKSGAAASYPLLSERCTDFVGDAGTLYKQMPEQATIESCRHMELPIFSVLQEFQHFPQDLVGRHVSVVKAFDFRSIKATASEN